MLEPYVLKGTRAFLGGKGIVISLTYPTKAGDDLKGLPIANSCGRSTVPDCVITNNKPTPQSNRGLRGKLY